MKALILLCSNLVSAIESEGDSSHGRRVGRPLEWNLLSPFAQVRSR
jgi:hypothetical protein